MIQKKTQIVILVLILLLLVGGGIFYIMYFSKNESTTPTLNTTEDLQTDEKANEIQSDNYDINVELLEDKHLYIKHRDGIYLEVLSTSIPESVIIAFDNKELSTLNGAVQNYLIVVPTEIAEQRAQQVKSDHKYKSLLEEYIAIESSTQCAKLLPTDFVEKQIGQYSVLIGNRQDRCTFNLEKPETQAMHMYGFQTAGYTVVLSVNGNVEKLSTDEQHLMQSVIEELEIR